MRKLISTFLFSIAYANIVRGTFENEGTNYCIICEYVNIAATVPAAETALEATTDPCIAAAVR